MRFQHEAGQANVLAAAGELQVGDAPAHHVGRHVHVQVVGAADQLAGPLARRGAAQHEITTRSSSDMDYLTCIDGLKHRAGVNAGRRELTGYPAPVED